MQPAVSPIIASHTEKMPILSLQDVHKDYLSDGGAVHALNGVSLDVARGFGLGGPQRLRKIHASESSWCDGLP